MPDNCHRCGGPLTGPTRWCEECQLRSAPRPYIRIERRTTGAGPRRWSVNRRFLHVVAAVLSLALPGAGQLYKGRIPQGIAWFVAVVAGYAIVGLPALLLHLMCVVNAGSAAPTVRRPVLSHTLR